MHTPNIDALIDEGILLERLLAQLVWVPGLLALITSDLAMLRHYTYKICSPTRSSIQSGRLAAAGLRSLGTFRKQSVSFRARLSKPSETGLLRPTGVLQLRPGDGAFGLSSEKMMWRQTTRSNDEEELLSKRSFIRMPLDSQP